MMMKLNGLLLLLVSLASLANPTECEQRKSNARTNRERYAVALSPTARAGIEQQAATMDHEIKQLGAGQHCTVVESFVFVARDAQTYNALENLNLNLPDPPVPAPNDLRYADFFKTHAVIAAFLGQRSTGGYGIEITQGADGVLRIAEQKARGMVTQVLTTPFKIVAVPAQADQPLALSLDATWTDRWRNYRVSGELTRTGGFAGIHENLGLDGSLEVMHAATSAPSSSKQSLLTLMFDLHSVGKERKELREVASGMVTGAGEVNLAHLDSRALSGAIQSPFRATGQFTNEEREVTLNLETYPTSTVSDNYTARATLRATRNLTNTRPTPVDHPPVNHPSTEPQSSDLKGVWGATGISMNVTDTGATLIYDCANGSIDEKIVLDRQGNFSARGYHMRQHPGPIRDRDEGNRQAAIYKGSVSGDKMTLTITVADSSEVIGTFTLIHGGGGRIRRCL